MRAIILVLIGCLGCDTSALDRFRAAPDGGGGTGGDAGEPDFSLSSSAPFLTVRQGASQSTTIRLMRTNGFNLAVPITVNGLPAGVTADPLTITSDTDMGMLTVHATNAAVQGGPVSLNVVGNAGGITHNATLNLVVAGAPGTLDQSFGNGGVVESFLGAASGATWIVIQPDGKIVTSGYIFNPSSGFELAIFRFNSDGSPDTTFGAAGRASFGVQMGSLARVVVRHADGQLVAVGKSQPLAQTSPSNFLLVGFHANGSVDTTFGNGGATTTDFGNNTGIANSAVLQSDGAIVAVGDANYTGFAMARYLADGSADGSFGGGHFVTTFGAMTTAQAKAVALDPGGKIVVAGWVADTSSSITLARYNSTDGSLDSTFGSGGVVRTPVSGDVEAMTLYPDGKMIVSGGVSNGVNDLANQAKIARFNVNGSVDFSFGGTGFVTAAPPSFASSALLHSDGSIFIAGTTIYDMGSTHFAVARFNADGSIDNSFGGNTGSLAGFLEILPNNGRAIAFSIAEQPDGRVLVAGTKDLFDPQGGIILARIWP